MSGPDTPEIRTDIPHSARIWNYWMHGKDNYDIDREIGDQCLDIFPGIGETAVESRRFQNRVVRWLAEAGVTQFLDLGAGLPTDPNTHQIAQAIQARARVVYADNDPMVLTHARALLTCATDEGVVGYADTDIRDPDTVLAAARDVLDLRQPVAVLCGHVLGHIDGVEHMHRVVAEVIAATAPGSYLMVHDSVDDTRQRLMWEHYATSGGAVYTPRPPETIAACFDGLALVEPGVVPVNHWRPDPPAGPVSAEAAGELAAPVPAYGGVGRRP
ncbi:SAM-dependent methyltransferase [Nocardia sp. CDC159]|uniref:SAM-dependent methyltransferase n=1 Tax=Nocardia pulmonis TaxID=2951408 RepID=A0A9X2IXB2_9NOCA|nr:MULTISPECIES: SAM-dependent methyltransferase [Nocardia]MCM6774444.1 SAM-dependent methyltransferase [Nocardia pulmonis]MCM6787490.1 SAM-dependent methyltransferase [Nocardia sp. CDC159]